MLSFLPSWLQLFIGFAIIGAVAVFAQRAASVVTKKVV